MVTFRFLRIYILALLVVITVIVFVIIKIPDDKAKMAVLNDVETYEWEAPDPLRLPNTAEGQLIRYGRSLIVNTSYYLGPKGTVAHISNGMNCQNCHLDAGTRFFGNNYSAVFTSYPKFRARSGMIENIHKRINDCFERSLNGKELDTLSREMQAMSAYINWLGRNVPRNKKPSGVGIASIPFLSRAASPLNGEKIFVEKCQRCHGEHGAGEPNPYNTGYTYPPLWGVNSFNTAAGLNRLSRLAGFIKYNMPFSTIGYDSTQLTIEQAWDVAAFVLSQPRPVKKYMKDWPDISSKPIDHPYAPYVDSFTEQQHKYGPFGPIEDFRKKLKK